MSTTEVQISDEQARIDLEKKLRSELRIEFEATYSKKLQEIEERLRDENQKAFKQVVEDWRKEQTPPTVSEIETLLSKEYFSVKVKVRDPKDRTKEKEFTIEEVPQKVEKKFVKIIEREFLPKIKELSAAFLNFGTAPQQNSEEKIKAVIEMFSPSLDVLASCVAIILDPYETDNNINEEWVADNISSLRMWNIIYAQERANGIRDFFSRVFQDFLKKRTSGGVSYRR